MTRRAVPLFAIAASAVALTGCATFTNTDRVAVVDGHTISRAEYEAMAEDFFGHPDVFPTQPVEAGHGEGGAARTLLSSAVHVSVLRDLVGAETLDAAVQEALAAEPDEVPLDEMSAEMRQLYGALRARSRGVLDSVAAPDAAALEQMYAERPAAAGVMCVRHILVDTKAEADAVVTRLAAGDDFAEVAAEVSTDTVTGADGGRVPSRSGSPCWTVAEAFQGLVGEFASAAVELEVGEPSDPVESPYGWHVIEQLPWADVADSVVAAHAEGITGYLQYDGALLTADVSVDPAFGVWDPATASVVALG